MKKTKSKETIRDKLEYRIDEINERLNGIEEIQQLCTNVYESIDGDIVALKEMILSAEFQRNEIKEIKCRHLIRHRPLMPNTVSIISIYFNLLEIPILIVFVILYIIIIGKSDVKFEEYFQ